VAPVVAPRILKLPVPPEKVQAILVGAQPGFGVSNTLKMGPQGTGFEMLWPSFKVMPCSPDQAELKLKPVPPAGFVFLVMVMVQAGGVGVLVKVHWTMDPVSPTWNWAELPVYVGKLMLPPPGASPQVMFVGAQPGTDVSVTV